MSTTKSDRTNMSLGVALSPASAHIAGWRHPAAVSNAGMTFDDMAALVKTAEEAKLDFAFLADELCAPEGDADILSRDPVIYRFEPLTLLAALSVVSQRIGLVVTQTTTYNEPYHIARKLASIDHLSDGRIGWNLVTSYVEAEARNFSKREHMGYEDRYGRAAEFFEVAAGLWDSWDDDAFVLDRASGRYFKPEGLHVLDHKGEHFTVRGPLNIRRPVQGRPVLVQSGASEPGLQLAARLAELTFTAQRTLDSAAAYYSDLKARMAGFGREPNALKVIAGVYPVIGATEEEAKRKYQELQELIHPAVGLARLSQLLGFDVTGMPLDARLPDDIPQEVNYQSRQRLIVDMARRENLTLGELYPKVVGSYGHRTIVGTPEMVADGLEEWYLNGACDGFMVLPSHLPIGLDDFAAGVVPELQRRGLFRHDYHGTTLREHLGLPRPERGQPLAMDVDL